MNTTYIKRFELLGYEIKNCTSTKEFFQDIKDRCYWNPYGDISFRKYMNDEIAGAYNCISDGWQNEDACIFIQYKDGTTYSFYPALGADGNFKENGIEWAIISDDWGYTTYKNDLSAEWEFLELSEEEKEAIELGISIEDYKKYRKTAEEFHKPENAHAEEEQTEAQAEEQAETTEEATEATEEQAEEQTESTPFPPAGFLEKPEYKIDILKELKECGYNTGYIRKNKIFPESTLQKFRSGNADISINTLFRVCQIINKDISEVIAFKEYTKKEVEEEKEAFPEVGKPEEPTKKEIITPEMHKEMIFEVCNKAKIFLPVLKGSEKQKKYAHDLMYSAIEYTKKGAKEEIERIEGYANDNGYTEEAQELAEVIEKGCIKIVNAYVEYFKTVTTCQEIIDIKGLLPIRQPNLNRLESASKKEKMDFANHVNKEMSKAFGENWKEKYK